MDIKTLVKPSKTGLQTIRKNFLNYASISTIVIGSSLATVNSANATAYTLSGNDAWGDASSLTNGTAIENPSANDTVDVNNFTLTIADTDGGGKGIGAITDGGAAGDVAVIGNTATNLTATAATIAVNGDVSLTHDATNRGNVTLTLGTGATTVGGTLNITNSDAAANSQMLLDVTGSLVVTGATTLVGAAGGNGADVALTVDKAATFTGGLTMEDGDDGLSTLNFNENNDVDITGTIDGATSGEGTLIVAGNTKDFKSAIGNVLKLKEVKVTGATTVFDDVVKATTVDVDAATTFTGAVTATTTTVDGATTFTGALTTATVVINAAAIASSTIDATTITLGGTGDSLSVSGNVTSAIVVTDSASALTLAGADMTVTGDINAAGGTDAGVINVTGAKVTFAGNLGAASGTNIDTVTVATGTRAVITETANFVDQIDIAGTGELEISKTVTSGTVITATGTTFEAADIVATSKIYMPVNLVGGETLIFLAGRDEDDISTAINVVLQDTALIDYTSANASGTHTITATAKSSATIATELSTTTNQGTAFAQALVAATNDTTADDDAEEAVYNALTANGGFSASEDTTLAKQVAPQTDLISGSTVAAQAVTGSVQGIMSNRMASLRSGDAYYGTGMSAGGLSAQSAFIQAFGSTAEQKSKTVGSGNQAGYDSNTTGFALGFDGITDDGITTGVSFSMSATDVDGLGTGKATNNIDSYTASLYMDKATDAGYIEGSITYGISENEASRKITSAGLSRSYKAAYDSDQISFKIGAGAPQEVGVGYLTPFGSLTGSFINTDAYTEKSSVADDALRLKVAQDDVSSMVGSIGFKFHAEMDNGGTPMISLAVNNEFGDNTIDSTNTFTGGGTAFKTSTAVEELSATLGLGYSYGSDAASIEIAYEADANDDDYLNHYGSIKIVGKF